MNRVFSRFVDDAADIKSSGRWTALNGHIKQMAASPGADNEWYVQLFGQFCYQVLSEYRLLQDAHAAKPGIVMPSSSRGGREISWSCRCGPSTSLRAGITRAASTKMLAATHTNSWLSLRDGDRRAGNRPIGSTRSPTAEPHLATRAAKEGIVTLDARYMRVDDAAAECGLKEHYKIMSKMLSKFVHPTALQILGLVDDAKHTLQRDCFFSLGCLFFAGGFVALEKVASPPPRA